MRPLLIAILVTLVLWWLFRPRTTKQRTVRHTSTEPTSKPVRTFRTPGGVATVVYRYDYRGGAIYYGWSCDCGEGLYESDRGQLRETRAGAIRHHETHLRGAP